MQIPNYKPIAVTDENTVVSEHTHSDTRDNSYQSEADMERDFIAQLQSQAYEYLDITKEKDLITNLRRQLEKLNDIQFSDGEWNRFFGQCIANSNDSIFEKTKRIQEDNIQFLKRDDGTNKNIRIIDDKNIHRNVLQVINQYESTGHRSNRYDVTILVNGLPLVHVELKRRGLELREAFNQIDRYRRDSFWANSGLFEYVQLFVISNGTLTKYYSNSVRDNHVKKKDSRKSRSKTQSSHSFSFTSWWADGKNRQIHDIVDFTKTFFSKHTLLNILTRYCVLTTDRKLLVMRPYQIAATEQILQRINSAVLNGRQLGTVQAGGYIWHATGSGKTLTSFKAAQLATQISQITKVLFVVDRKDLDYQTMKEYDKFQEGAANSNSSTKMLAEQLNNPKSDIIITTIQKLSRFVTENSNHAIYTKPCVLIFDECHRSQFGNMHRDIVKNFKKYSLFGFTGTPIFTDNALKSPARRQTTEQVFGDKLHTYTIVNAIEDKNVLPFRIDYIKTISARSNIDKKKVQAINTKRALLDPKRVHGVVDYIRLRFDQKTKRHKQYTHSGKRLQGFNSIFGVESIEAAKHYYEEFKQQQTNTPESQRLRIGLIYSSTPNDARDDGFLDDEQFEPEKLDQSSRDFLEGAIQDYNVLFNTSYSTNKFESYYKDISDRLKSRQLDLVIVVNMFLTGFDATTINTLWLDKPLRTHGLFQAFSRTNRILNSVKSYGNIVSFRDLQAETDEALKLFGNKDAKNIVILKPYAEYEAEYRDLIAKFMSDYSPGENITGEKRKKDFVKLFGKILQLRNILTSFDDFDETKHMSQGHFQDYKGVYLHLHKEFTSEKDDDSELINNDVIFEIELIKQIEVNVDYILTLLEQGLTHDQTDRAKKDELWVKIKREVDASPTLRDKRDLIEAFVHKVSGDSDIREEWRKFVANAHIEELTNIIENEKLKPAETQKFIKKAFHNRDLSTIGTEFGDIFYPISKFKDQKKYLERNRHVIKKLMDHFNRFVDFV